MTGPAAKPERYYVHVLGFGCSDVATAAGGWILDHLLAGWGVTVWLQDCNDTRPLEILGVLPRDLSAALPPTGGNDVAGEVILRSSEYFKDSHLRARLFEALGASPSDCVVWVHAASLDSDIPSGRVPHRLSRVAATFKLHALAALGTDIEVSSDETFWTPVVPRCEESDINEPGETEGLYRSSVSNLIDMNA